MVATLGGALEARKIPSFPNKLWAEAEGVIEAPEGVMKLTRVHVKLHLRIPAGTRTAAERAISVFERGCPIANTLRGCVTITHDHEIEEEDSTA
ncbi:MAG TPA: OsmC family protein [Oscillatoriaceae cyanobacterium]